MAKKTVKGKLKAQMKQRVVWVLAAVTVFFGVLYLPDEVTQVFGQRFEVVGKLLAKLGVMLPFTLLAGWFLFGQDHLATGRGRASRFFRHYYPSTFAVQRCKLKTQKEADNLWFTYFNPWEDPSHENHGFYKTQFERSYTCRLFYYLVRILTWYLVAAAVSIALWTWIIPTQDADRMLIPRVIVWVLGALLTLSISLSNRIQEVPGASYWDAYRPTGAYYKYREIQGILQQHFWEDVLGPRGCPPPA